MINITTVIVILKEDDLNNSQIKYRDPTRSFSTEGYYKLGFRTNYKNNKKLKYKR